MSSVMVDTIREEGGAGHVELRSSVMPDGTLRLAHAGGGGWYVGQLELWGQRGGFLGVASLAPGQLRRLALAADRLANFIDARKAGKPGPCLCSHGDHWEPPVGFCRNEAASDADMCRDCWHPDTGTQYTHREGRERLASRLASRPAELDGVDAAVGTDTTAMAEARAGRVTVTGQRTRIDPPELGDCQDPDCRTVPTGSLERPEPRTVPRGLEGDWSDVEAQIGRGLLLVAIYYPGGIRRGPDGRATNGIRVCSPCDERALRRWVDEDREDERTARAATPDPDAPPCPECGGGLAHFPECSAATRR